MWKIYLLVNSATGRSVVAVDRSAVCASIVRRRQRSAVVVPELDDHVVAGLDRSGHGCEAPLAGETARGTAGDGIVDDGKRRKVA